MNIIFSRIYWYEKNFFLSFYSTGYQNTWIVRFWYQTLLIWIGAFGLFVIGDSTREDRAKREVKPDFDAINPLNMERYMKNLNDQIESFDSSSSFCYDI